MPILLALVSAVAYGVSDYCGGRATRAAPTFVVTLTGQLAAAACTIGMLLVLAGPFPDRADIGWSVAAGVATTVGVTAFYHALANGAMTVVAPLTAVVSAVVPVAAGLAAGERPGAVAAAGIAVAVVAVALVSGVGGTAERSTPVPIVLFAVLGGVGFGLLFVFLDRTGDDSGVWPLFIAQLASLPIVSSVVVVRRLRFPPPRRIIAVMALGGALAVTANVAYLAATRVGLLSLVAVVTSLYPASTVVLATLLDGERVTPTQRGGLALVVVALGLVAAGSP